ncbi:ribosome recycling factor [Candidatus Azobacteroides pseudotrichonymphae]|uniref:Ribosome-recycling factor n=1 Tax=Azobacteroides pseudotrichonymphae genomovar. CFP2 TaxID=511995 RepID=B6YS45_AZOPC|nr:ribosome recycling factor [Candidatus Azobacteroides pseudotrichonymphae]BAG84017.1 ribosome recycling factor [Candidatus Azobacteroides pseudotrichonymphae genomovar. CFP2]
MKNIMEHSEKKMLHTLTHLEEVLSRIRAGKASTHILDGIKIEYYGNVVPLSNVANISILDAKTITILAWEKAMMKPIEKAIQDSDIGITPENNGELVRLNIPPLTEERRKQLVKQSKGEVEKAKVGIRNIRRETNDMIKKFVKEGIFSEDEGKKTELATQKLHDKFLKKIDKVLIAKVKDIMTV